mgnify:CR=1 FL=1
MDDPYFFYHHGFCYSLAGCHCEFGFTVFIGIIIVIGIIADIDRAGISEPDIAEAAVNDFEPGQVTQQFLGRGAGFGPHDHEPDVLITEFAQGAHQRRHLGLCRDQVFLPQVFMAGKAHPHRLVRFPFRRNYSCHYGYSLPIGLHGNHSAAAPVYGLAY